MNRKDRGVRDLGHQKKKNAFQNFPQREFDYDTLVLAEINKGSIPSSEPHMQQKTGQNSYSVQ